VYTGLTVTLSKQNFNQYQNFTEALGDPLISVVNHRLRIPGQNNPLSGQHLNCTIEVQWHIKGSDLS
jgi:hypothetical protein